MVDERVMGSIREAGAVDQQRIHEIAVAGWRPIYARFRLIVGERMWQDLWGNWEESWFANAPEQYPGRAIVTEVDGQVVGFATWWFSSEQLAEVGGNAVDPQFQGRGIGAAQIQWVIDFFRRQGYPYAKVHTGLDPAHGPARAAYRKAGLRLGVTNSQYYNYLDEVARLPLARELEFRWAEPGDEARVRQLVQGVWGSGYEPLRRTLGDGLFAAAFAAAVSQRQEEVIGTVAGAPERLRLAIKDGQMIGLALLDDDREKGLGMIKAIFVDPGFRKQGMGGAVCMDAFAVFRQHGWRYAQLAAGLGEVNERLRRLCWNVGLYRELPSIDYYLCL